MRSFGLFVSATVFLALSMPAAAATWQLEQDTGGFANTDTISAFTTSNDAKLVLRCENKDRIMILFQPDNIISEGGHVPMRYRIGQNPTISSNDWISLYGIAAYWGAKKSDQKADRKSNTRRQQIIAFAQSLMKGKDILIEAENERAQFSLEGSSKTISRVLAACGAV